MEKVKEILRLSNQSVGRITALITASVIAGLCGFLFIVLVNGVIQALVSNNGNPEDSNLIFYFITIITLFIGFRRFLSKSVIVLSQNLFWNIRKEIIRMIIKSDFIKIKESKDDIYSALTNDAGSITQASLLIIDLLSSIILIISCFVYMLFISPVLFAISMATIIVGILSYQVRIKHLNQLFDKSRTLENDFLKYFNALLHGTKEVNVDEAKGEQIYNTKIEPVVLDAYDNNKNAFVGYLNNQITGQILFYLLITFILIYAGSLLNVEVGIIISFVFVLLYVLGPIESIMVIIPFINRAVIAVNRLIKLRDGLVTGDGRVEDTVFLKKNKNIYDSFTGLKVKGLEFKFNNKDNAFRIGPINFDIEPGEIAFIFGGNGSGKSTFLYSLLGLYRPTGGEVSVNNEVISTEDLVAYQHLFAPVFSDFYLFDEFYGINGFDREEVESYLKLFEIDEKVTVEDNKFSTIDLSTGQRKRLALIAAILERKPILMLDEWAADQDPVFRKKFYLEILPLLKNKGFSVLAITHDDKYYECCDRLYKMEYGSLKEKVFTRVETF